MVPKKGRLSEKFVIEGELTDLNTHLGAANTNRYIANSIKQDETDRVGWACKSIGPITEPVRLKFTWYCKNKRKDPDNIVFAKKYILDGLVSVGVLENDGWNQIIGWDEEWFVDKENPRVEVELIF